MPIHLLPPACRSFCSARRWRQRLHDLLPAAELLDAGLVLFAEVQRRDEPQPFLRDLRLDSIGQCGDALEHLAEDTVEAVEVALVLDEAGARQEVEFLDLASGDAGIEALEQGEILLQRDREAGALQGMEESDEHACLRSVGRDRPTIGKTVRG